LQLLTAPLTAALSNHEKSPPGFSVLLESIIEFKFYNTSLGDSMSAIKNFIGIDISKGWLDFAAICPSQKKEVLEFRLDNNPADIKKIKGVLRKRGISLGKKTLFTFEHIGTYSRPLIKYLTVQRCAICQENPLRIKRSLGIQRGKSDKIDAKRILEYSVINLQKLHIWDTPNPMILQLKDLISMRERFSKIEKMLKSPMEEKKSFLSKKYIDSLNKIQRNTLVQVQSVTKVLNGEIKKSIAADAGIQHKVDLITSIPGIGPVTAAYLVCATRGFTAFSTGNQLACYAGCVPFPHSSGISVRGKSRVSQIANKKLKSLVHMAAMSCIRPKNEFKKYYDRKVKEGKPKMSVINAIRCKLLMRVAAVIKRDQAYLSPSRFKRLMKSQPG
jgi:transposase